MKKGWRWILLLFGMILTWQCLREPTAVRTLESVLVVDLPRGIGVEYTDTHGGFHGDGELNAVVMFQSAKQGERFVRQISDTWMPLPAKTEILSAVRQEWAELPMVEEGYWMFRDRYFEQYGERASYRLWNSTFAVLDTEEWMLYVFELDL